MKTLRDMVNLGAKPLAIAEYIHANYDALADYLLTETSLWFDGDFSLYQLIQQIYLDYEDDYFGNVLRLKEVFNAQLSRL